MDGVELKTSDWFSAVCSSWSTQPMCRPWNDMVNASEQFSSALLIRFWCGAARDERVMDVNNGLRSAVRILSVSHRQSLNSETQTALSMSSESQFFSVTIHFSPIHRTFSHFSTMQRICHLETSSTRWNVFFSFRLCAFVCLRRRRRLQWH